MICPRGHWTAAAAIWFVVLLWAQSPAIADGAGAGEAPSAVDADTPVAATRSASGSEEGRIEDRRVPPKGIREDSGVGSSPPTLDPLGWWKTVAALALVVGIIFILKRYLVRHGVGGGPRVGGQVVEVLTRTAVSGKHQVMLLRVGGRLLVVGAGPDTLNTLAEITDPEQVGELLGIVEQGKAASITSGFANSLRGLRSQVGEEMSELDDHGDPVCRTPAGSAADRVRGVLGKVRDFGSNFRRRA